MRFKTWKDQYLFIKHYTNASCLTCKYGGEIDESNDDGDFKRIFCRKYLSMVEFAFQFICAGWESNDGKRIEDFDDDCPLYKLKDGLFDILEDENKTWSFEEVKEVIENYEEVKE